MIYFVHLTSTTNSVQTFLKQCNLIWIRKIEIMKFFIFKRYLEEKKWNIMYAY